MARKQAHIAGREAQVVLRVALGIPLEDGGVEERDDHAALLSQPVSRRGNTVKSAHTAHGAHRSEMGQARTGSALR